MKINIPHQYTYDYVSKYSIYCFVCFLFHHVGGYLMHWVFKMCLQSSFNHLFFTPLKKYLPRKLKHFREKMIDLWQKSYDGTNHRRLLPYFWSRWFALLRRGYFSPDLLLPALAKNAVLHYLHFRCLRTKHPDLLCHSWMLLWYCYLRLLLWR